MIEKIGNVTLDYTFYPGEDFYCDGAIEDELLSIVQQYKEEEYPRIIREKKSWEVLYHLSDLRENIVAWLPMDKSMKVLDVGAGCGAVTGGLAKKAGSVTCVDLSKKRSLINAYRHREMDNITIKLGNFRDVEPSLDTDYDYVCLTGVFEYGQAYIGGDTPFTDFYKILQKHVKKGGHIVIAIENKMGLKYWAGCREDHLGTFFSGLEDYPEGGVVRTFTKAGLEKILQACGESEYQFYYPYPDYKFMTMAYSDRYLPKVGELSNNLRNFDRDRMLLFDEKKVFDMLIREGLFPLYSNSYMVVTGPVPETIFTRFSNDRAESLCIRTDIGQSADGKKYVRKYPAGKKAVGHIQDIAKNYEIFSAEFEGSGLQVNRLVKKEDEAGLPFVELEFLEQAVTLEELLDNCLQKNDREGFRQLFDRYRRVVGWRGTEKLQDFDLIFPNICVQGDVWTMIDYEWVSQDMAAEDLVKRALYCYVLENGKRKEHPILQEILQELQIDDSVFAQMAAKERAFQKNVMEADQNTRTAITDMRHLIGNKAVPAAAFFERAERKKAQIFEDFGTGYTAEQSYYTYDAYEADDLLKATIICKEHTAGIRLDPCEMPCLLRLRRVCVDGRELTAEELQRAVVTNGQPLAATGQESCGSLLFDNNDPNINVRLDVLGVTETGGVAVQIEAEILWLSAGMLADLKAMGTRRKRGWFQR